LAVSGGREVIPVVNALLELPFVFKVATKDHHPPGHISFASSHEGKQPFTSFTTIRNPNNPDEAYESRLWPDHCVVGTAGNELAEGLDVRKVDLVLEKGTDPRVEMYSAFKPPLANPPLRESESGLENILKEKGITDVYFVGLAGDYCVRFSAIDCAKVKDAGWNTYVVEDGIRSVDPGAGWEEARAEMLNAGVKIVRVSDEVVQRVSS
jgi:nicotinamidase-related amidase